MTSNSDEPVWLPPRRRDRAAVWKLANGEDVERGLTAAERMWGQALEDARHSQNLQIVLVSTATLGLASLLGFGLALYDSRFLSYQAIASLVAFITIISTIVGAFLIRRISVYRYASQFGHSRRLAAELAAMIEAAYLEISEREQWSYLRLQTTKLRLAAFPLSERIEQGSGDDLWNHLRVLIMRVRLAAFPPSKRKRRDSTLGE